MKNPFIIPTAMICATILAGIWMLKPPSKPPEPPDVSIHDAAGDGHIEAVKQHLAAGTYVNAKLKFLGSTPLHRVGTKEVAELLIAKGADVNAKDEDGETPLYYAIARQNPKTADLLRKHGGKTGEELKAEGK